MAALYSGTIEFILGILFTFIGGFLFLKGKMHVTTLGIWALYRMIYTFELHCGYDLPWHLNKIIPFGIDGKHHDLHHTQNIGNFGEFTRLWDILFKTEFL